MEKYKTSLDRIEEVINKELKRAEENYFNADSCDECPQKTIDVWKDEMEKITFLKTQFELIKNGIIPIMKSEELIKVETQIDNNELEALEKQAEELSLEAEREDFTED